MKERGPFWLELKHKIWRLRDWAWRGSLCPVCGSRHIVCVRMCMGVSKSGAGGIFPRCKSCGWDSDGDPQRRLLRRTPIQSAVYRVLRGMRYPGNKGLPGLRGVEFLICREDDASFLTPLMQTKIEPMKQPSGDIFFAKLTYPLESQPDD